MRMHWFVLLLCGCWGVAQASSVIYQLRMNLPETPPARAAQPPMCQVLPGSVVFVPAGEAGYLPYYGYEPLAAAGYGGQIVSAPLLATAPGYVPTLIQPIAPPPMRLRWLHPGPGVIAEPDPHFYNYVLPQTPLFLTNGMAVYGVPNESATYLFEMERQRHRR